MVRKGLFVGLLLLLLAGPAKAAYSPVFGLHVDGVDLIAGFPSVASFMDEVQARGYQMLMVNLIPDKYYFNSPTLAGLGYEFGTDYLTVLVSEADARGIEMFVDIQSLAWKARNWEGAGWIPGQVPATNDVASVVQELLTYGVAGISEEGFLADWFTPTHALCQLYGATYIHKTVNGDIENAWRDGSTVFASHAEADVIMSEDYYLSPRLAADSMVAALARGLGKPYWMKSTPERWGRKGNGPGSVANMINVMVLRAIEQRPLRIIAMIDQRGDFDAFQPAAVLSLLGRFTLLGSARPLAEIVLEIPPGLGSGAEDLGWHFGISAAAIINSLYANGYEVALVPAPTGSAALTYVYTAGADEGEGDLYDPAPSIAALLTDPLAGNLFLHLGRVMPGSGAVWPGIRSNFGIGPRLFAELGNGPGWRVIPRRGVFEGRKYRHCALGNWQTMMSDTKLPDLQGATAVTSGRKRRQEYVLISESSGRFFINSSGLDAEAAYPLMRLMGDADIYPVRAVLYAGSPSAFYAWRNAKMQVKLPASIAAPGSLKLTEVGRHGEVSTRTVTYDPATGVRIRLKKWHLLVLE